MIIESRIMTVVTGTASAALLYTALSGAPPRRSNPLGVKPMFINSTCESEFVSYVVDPKTEHWIKFKKLALQWKQERGAQSTVLGMSALPSYVKIIGMGPDALPLILKQLKSEAGNPDHWFWALAAISDENPVPPESRGKLSEMAKAWIAWGESEGYV
ncbi:MAG: hypothetical protein ACYDA9_10630 [Terriglobia bacterium]